MFSRRSTKAGGRTPATRVVRGGPVAPHRRRSTKAGGRTPATRVDHDLVPTRRHTLNEGRGSNPGDTLNPTNSTANVFETAQRRPGVEPRRHIAPDPTCGSVLPRSTKAGGRTPATLSRCSVPGMPRLPTLNEGRGSNPGDTRRVCHDPGRGLARSTKAGGRTPATHLVPAPSRQLLGRSTKAGGRTPATPPGGRRGRTDARRALNEGRGSNPGDTPARPRRAARSGLPLNEGRGSNPGDTPAASSKV